MIDIIYDALSNYSIRSKMQVILTFLDSYILLCIQTYNIYRCLANSMNLEKPKRPTFQNRGSMYYVSKAIVPQSEEKKTIISLLACPCQKNTVGSQHVPAWYISKITFIYVHILQLTFQCVLREMIKCMSCHIRLGNQIRGGNYSLCPP